LVSWRQLTWAMAAPTIVSQISAIDDQPSCVLPIENEGRVVGTLRCEPS
jgi:hypothetical protein